MNIQTGRSGGTRTRDLLNPIQARYHLRYTPTVCSCFLSRTQDLFYCINRPLSRTFSNKSEFERKIKIIFHLDENCPEITCRMFYRPISSERTIGSPDGMGTLETRQRVCLGPVWRKSVLACLGMLVFKILQPSISCDIM